MTTFVNMASKQGGKSCAAINCITKYNSQNISLFRFPKDAARCKKWRVNTRRSDLDCKSVEELNQNYRLCSRHFEDSQFMNIKHDKLIWSAIPTLFDDPNKPSPVTQKQHWIVKHTPKLKVSAKTCANIPTERKNSAEIDMASKPCDDPMNLGPFLQNYVLRNPFRESVLGSGQLSEHLPKPKERRAIRKVLLASSINGSDTDIGPSASGRLKRSAKQDDDGSGDGSSPGHATPRKLFVTSVENSSLDLSGSDLTEVAERTIKQEVEVVDGGCASMDDLASMNSTTGMQDLLSDYPEVHQWLCLNFKYLSQYQHCLTSATILLHKVQTTFPLLTKVVLGQLISVAFPCCPKIVQEGETFYRGLVPKLAKSILENATPNFMTALENVTIGLMNVQEASEKFGVSEIALKSVLMWDKVDLAVNGITSSTKASLSLSSLLHANGTSCKRTTGSREFGKESRIGTASTRTIIRHRAIKRDRSLSVTVDVSAPVDSNDDSIDIQSESSACVLQRAIIPTPSKDIVDRQQSSPDNTWQLSVKEELPEEISEPRTELKTRSANSSRSRLSISSEPIDILDNRSVGDAVTKSTSCSNSPTESPFPAADRRSSPFSINSARFLEKRRKKQSILGSGSSVASDLKRRFLRMKQDLANCQSANLKLQNELESVQSENLLLKEELKNARLSFSALGQELLPVASQTVSSDAE